MKKIILLSQSARIFCIFLLHNSLTKYQNLKMQIKMCKSAHLRPITSILNKCWHLDVHGGKWHTQWHKSWWWWSNTSQSVIPFELQLQEKQHSLLRETGGNLHLKRSKVKVKVFWKPKPSTKIKNKCAIWSYDWRHYLWVLSKSLKTIITFFCYTKNW